MSTKDIQTWLLSCLFVGISSLFSLFFFFSGCGCTSYHIGDLIHASGNYDPFSGSFQQHPHEQLQKKQEPQNKQIKKGQFENIA